MRESINSKVVKKHVLNGESIKEVRAAVGTDEINQAINDGWVVYGVPTIPVGEKQFYWMMVKR